MTKRQRTVLILILGAIAALGPFSIDMYLPGFPAIAEDLNTDIAHVSLTLTTYFIGISIGQLVYGPLLDRYGRKKPLLAGLSIFFVAAIGCALSPNIYWLIGMRLVLALGGCVGMVAGNAIIRDLFPVNEVARTFSAILLVMGVAPIIAPTLGGFFMDYSGWRTIFVFIGVVAAIIIFVVYRFLGESKSRDSSVSLKMVHITRNYAKVLSNNNFVMYGMAGSVGMAVMFAYVSGIPFVLIEIYGLSESTFGWVFGMNAFGFISGSQVNRFLLKKYDLLKLTRLTSFIQIFIALALLIGTIFFELPVAVFVGLLFITLFLLGFINPNSSALSLEPFTKNIGLASALNGSFRMGSGAVASALIGIFHDGTTLPMVIIIAIFAVFSFLLLLGAGKPATD